MRVVLSGSPTPATHERVGVKTQRGYGGCSSPLIYLVAGARNGPTATASAPLEFRFRVLFEGYAARLSTVPRSAVDDPVLSMPAQGATVSLA
jgi:hypothetical protein